jgi:serine protease
MSSEPLKNSQNRLKDLNSSRWDEFYDIKKERWGENLYCSTLQGCSSFQHLDEEQLIPASSSTPPNSTSGSTFASSHSRTTAQNQNSSTQYFAGTLRADTFTYQPSSSRTIYSGNGNIDFGSGTRDTLDLSRFSYSQVTLNFANTATGGVIANNGKGNRVFDAITLENGNQILFEGIEEIKLADKVIPLSVMPNDPLFNQQWNLHTMGVQNAWRFTTGSDKILIGIQDTGLGTDSSGKIHSDLRVSNYIGNNYLEEASGLSFSHGTLVQGTIAASSNNGIGISGINWNSPVVSIDVIDETDYTLANATQAMLDEANKSSQRLVINLSLSGGVSTEFENLIANNQDKALFVMASGNQDRNSTSSLAELAKKYNNVTAVGASWGNTDWYGRTTTPGERISYANWWGSNYGESLTLMAPSEFPATSAHRNSSGTFDFDYNSKFNGTSASTANVTGVASLVWSANPTLSATQIRDILTQTAYDLGASGYDTVYGYGMVNADAAVRQAMAIARGY